MKKGEIYEGVIEEVLFPNKGIIHTEDGYTVIVKNSVPGQKVRFSVSKKRKKKIDGRLVQVLEKAPNELLFAPCPHFGICGGCTYLNLPYEEQIALKAEQIKKLLSPVVSDFDDVFEGILKSPHETEYRNKMEFTFGDAVKGGPLSLGMHKRGSFYDIVTVEDCVIMPQDFRTIMKATLDYFEGCNAPFYHRMRHEGYLRHLLVRRGEMTGELFVCLVTTSQMPDIPEQTLLHGWKFVLNSLKLEGKLVGVAHTVNDSLADAVIDEGTTILMGDDHFTESLLGLSFRVTPFSFFQTNSAGAEVLYKKAREYVGEIDGGALLYDLYSGTGTIAQMMAPAVKKVIGVEIVEEAVKAAKENAALNGLDNCDFIAGDVLKVLDDIAEKPDYIILDPPRDGIHPKALKKIIDYGVDNMVYISCKPTSLARDLVPLYEAGYRVKRICCVDMFPATANVETVCLLSN